jgi:hypothetical protein
VEILSARTSVISNVLQPINVIASAAMQSIFPRVWWQWIASLRSQWRGNGDAIRNCHPRAGGDPVRRGFSVLSLASLEYWVTRMRG